MATKLKTEDPTLTAGDTTNRTIDDKLYDIKSSKDFGGASDGVTDDTSKINTGVSTLATGFSAGILILPVNTVYTEASLVLADNVTIMDFSIAGKLRILCKDQGDILPITKGGLEIKTQDIEAILLSTHNGGVSGNPYLRLLNSSTGALAGLKALFQMLTGYMDIVEATAPAAPAANIARIYCQDNGSGKTQLMVRFNTGAPIQLAIQP